MIVSLIPDPFFIFLNTVRIFYVGAWVRTQAQRMESKTENHMTSAAAFVEGGIQESCDDACCICLEEFCDNDPSTVTVCRHEFHLQCVLDWCQRSSQCPMCWQPISLTDPTGQELFKAVEQERNFWANPSRNVNTFHHSTVRDFGLQHPRLGVNDYDLEERLLQHLAVVASNERVHQLGRREGRQIQPIQQTPRLQTESTSTYGPPIMETNGQETYSVNRNDAVNYCLINQNRARPSELHSFSDTLRSRLNAMSMRYKESISKGTRCWKNKLLFPRSSSMAEGGTNARKEINPRIPRASQSVKFIGAKKNSRVPNTSLSNSLKEGTIAEASNQNCVEVNEKYSSCDNNNPTASSTSSHLN